jgi:cell division protein FtsB
VEVGTGKKAGGNGKEGRARRRRKILFLLLAFLLILGLLTVFGEKGILHLLRLQKELVQIKEENKKVEEENEKLKEEVRRLQYEKRYIEEIARRELGMVKEGEVIYQFDPPAEGKERSK